MEKLIEELQGKIRQMNERKDFPYNLEKEMLDKLYSVYPFNKFEYVISHLLASNTIRLDDYLKIRNDYLERNKYLYLFEITAPRTFGETWAQRHLSELVPEIEIPSKQKDENYSGQYDFWYNGIRIEVKASRAVSNKSDDSLVLKALSSDSKLEFNMNFQQIKPDCFDVCVWIGVWTDKIRYWILSREDILNNSYFSKGQHRGNKGEGQLWLTNKNIVDFSKYETSVRDICVKIQEKYSSIKNIAIK